MIIIKADKNHIDEIVSIESEESDYPAWGKKGFLKEFENNLSITYLAIIDGNAVGFINFRHIDDFIEINSVIVKKEYRKKGVGTKLLEKVINYATENKCVNIYLDVDEGNTAALNLYSKFGFEFMYKRKKYYPNFHDAVVMKKGIKE